MGFGKMRPVLTEYVVTLSVKNLHPSVVSLPQHLMHSGWGYRMKKRENICMAEVYDHLTLQSYAIETDSCNWNSSV